MNKKFIYLIIGIVIILFGLIVLIAITVAKPVESLVNPDKDAISLSTLSSDSQYLFYYDQKSSIKRWNLQTNQVEDWLQFPFSKIDNISYSPDKSLAIVYWSNPNDVTDIHTWLVDLTNKKIIKEISQNISNSAWSPDGEQLVTQYWNEKQNKFEIDLYQTDGTNLKKISDDDAGDINLLWPNSKTVIYFPMASEASQNDVNAINLQTLKQTTILQNKAVINAKNLIDQNTFIVDLMSDNLITEEVASYNLLNNKLSIIKSGTNLNKITPISTTNNFYVAIRPDKQTTDDIIKINSDTNKTENVRTKLPGKIDATNLAVSADNKYLYFISDKNFYRLKL